MSDIKLRFNTDLIEGSGLEATDALEGDFIFNDNDLEMDDGLATAVIISLYTDKRASLEDVLPDPINGDRRGWWGDKVSPEIEGDEIGSKLWLLERSILNDETVTLAEQYATEALQHLIEDGIAKEIIVLVERSKSGDQIRLGLDIKITKSDGSKVNFKFDDLWNATFMQTEI